MESPTPFRDFEHIPTVIVGGGQAGLVVGYHLRQVGVPFVILDAMERTGDSWRQHWNSLRLFSPPRYASLPGWRNPSRSFPTRDEMADYLEQYAERFALPIRHGIRVERLARTGRSFLLQTSAGVLTADRVIVATGGHQRPRVPAFAGDLDPQIRQLHSSAYREPSQLQGQVLVVGAANSGADIALESAANGHPTVIAGRHPGEIPFDIEAPIAKLLVPLVMFAFRHVLTLGTPPGRAMYQKVHGHGVGLVRHKRRELDQAGVRRTGRITGLDQGRPVAEGGEVLSPDTVVWCTGFQPDFSWIDLPIFTATGQLRHQRGVVGDEPGLFFLGLEFQYAVASATIQGLDRDARYLLRSLRRTGTPPHRPHEDEAVTVPLSRVG